MNTESSVLNETRGKNIVLTPPATPSASPIPAVGELPRPEQWLGKVAAGVGRPTRANSLGADPFLAETDWVSRSPQPSAVSTKPYLKTTP